MIKCCATWLSCKNTSYPFIPSFSIYACVQTSLQPYVCAVPSSRNSTRLLGSISIDERGAFDYWNIWDLCPQRSVCLLLTGETHGIFTKWYELTKKFYVDFFFYLIVLKFDIKIKYSYILLKLPKHPIIYFDTK